MKAVHFTVFIIAGFVPTILFGVAEKDARVEPGQEEMRGRGLIRTDQYRISNLQALPPAAMHSVSFTDVSALISSRNSRSKVAE